MDARDLSRQQFLQDFFGTDYTLTPLTGDASFRHYYRISQGDDHFLLMDAPPDKESVAQFVHVANLFGQVVNTPDIIKKDIKNGFLLLQDFGTVQFADVLDGNNQALYQNAFTTLVHLQSLPTDDLPLYSTQLLSDELSLFCDWFIPYVGATTPACWQDVCTHLINHLHTQPQVVVHRDYHSRNLMLADDTLGVIDFQDAVVGSYAYDVASLVRDAYIDQDGDWVMARLHDAHTILAPTLPFEQFCYDVALNGVQRGLKVLGIFVRLSQRDGKDRYLANLPKVLQDTKDQLAVVLAKDQNPSLSAFANYLHTIQLPTPKANHD